MRKYTAILSTLALSGAMALPVHAQDAEGDTEERIEELEEQVEILSEEVQKKGDEHSGGGVLAGEPVEGSRGGISHHASKIYTKGPGLSIGGYGQTFFKATDTGPNTALPLRQILYFGYRFNDWIVFNSEFEFETEVEQEDGGTEREHEAEVEFAYLDFAFDPRFNARAGLVLLPLGIINEEHEPPTFFGNERPFVEKTIIPTTLRENAVGAYGELAGGAVEYVGYLQNGFDAGGLGPETASEGLGDVKQDGAAFAEDLAFSGSVDWHPMLGATVGVSGLHGDMDQLNRFSGDATITMWDVHGEWKRDGLWLRGLFTQADIDDTRSVNNTVDFDPDTNVRDAPSGNAVPEKMQGWYVEGGYNILRFIEGTGNQKLYPWVRYSQVDTQDEVVSGFSKNGSNDREIITAGVHYMPHPQVAIKAEFRDFDSDGPTNNQEEFLVGLGYNF